jgi:hypothetical protein
MILQPVLCMMSSGISGHSQIMPDLPPLRQPELASFRVPFIPRLKPGVYWLFLLSDLRTDSYPFRLLCRQRPCLPKRLRYGEIYTMFYFLKPLFRLGNSSLKCALYFFLGFLISPYHFDQGLVISFYH